jgi:surfeit locus 1 family protein
MNAGPLVNKIPRRGSAWILLAAVATMAVTARMGWWQLDRAAQKETLQATMQRQGAAPELPASELAIDPAAAPDQWQRRISLQGRWLPEATVYLENRQMHGRPGFFVVTPLRLPEGDAVLVQRGWIPRDLMDRTHLVPVATPEGEVGVSGRIAPWPSRLTELGADATGPIRQNLDLAAYAAETRLALRPSSVVELPAPGNAGDGLLRDWPLPAVDVHKHYGYAVQWFLLCALTAGLYVWFQILRPRRHAADPAQL